MNISDAEITLKDIIKEANRCLNCKNPKCKEGCPISNDIPEFIHEMSRGNMGNAMDIISQKSNLAAVCGRVCPHEMQCEGHCVLGKTGNPIKIGTLERFAADFSYDMKFKPDKIMPKTKGKVAVIGSGPAGLTVAGDLAKKGFSVTVFESLPEPGGVLIYGIPEFRLSNDIVRREIKMMETQGVNFITNSTAGVDFNVDDLFSKNYDAIFIGSGTAVSNTLDIDGADLSGVVKASYLLRMISLYNSEQVKREEVPLIEGENVIVIGGGNVSIDAARSAIRLGAKSVGIIYRGTEDTMPALRSEYELAVADGVNFYWEHTPAVFIGEDGKLKGIKAQNNENEVILPCDKVFLAIGSRPANRIVSTTEGIDVDNNGYVITKERPYGMTTKKGVFAGGDVVHRPATVVLAMREAKKVAEGIADYIAAVELLK